MTEKFLLTGGQGFIGAWVARRLLEEGTHFAILDRQRDDGILSQVLPAGGLPGLERIWGDIADGSLVRRAVEEPGITHVIHLAGLQVPACRADPLAGAMVNVIGTLNVFEAARKSGRVKSIAYASSAAVAGAASDYRGRISDDAHHVPRTHYGVFKTANEGNARVYYFDHGISSVGLRPLAVYGPGREVGITSGPTKAIKAALLGRPYTIGFTGPTGFSYVEDVAAAFIACARAAPAAALALNLPGEVAAVEDFVRALEEEVPGARGRITCAGDPLPVAHDFAGDGLAKLLGGAGVPRTSIREGIRATARLFRTLLSQGRLHDRDLH
jgi:nucleoside-diphosphate-sugar epimerase